jgi:hypothetical protein
VLYVSEGEIERWVIERGSQDRAQVSGMARVAEPGHGVLQGAPGEHRRQHDRQ